MKFSQRLSYYLFGFILGSFFLFFVLGKKNARCSYFPNDRVLKDLRSKPFYYSKSSSLILAKSWIDTIDIKNTLTYGDVDFSRSNIKKGDGKKYVVIGKTTKNIPLELEVINYEKKVVLEQIKKL